MSFRGSCHCGRLAYEVDEDPPTKAMACNCSICRRKGALHHFTTPDRFRREAADEDIQVYTFNTHNIRHQFCGTCGCAPFAEGTGPNGPMVEINLRCAEGVDLEALEVTMYDGASR
jgi:hypothetical protein